MTLPAHAEIIVIGGGIIGCSTAYHLARDHGCDVLLLEQGALTGGSTWHAAGLVGQLRSSASITQVLKYSVDLYKRLHEETGLDTGWRMTGCLRLACNQDRWTEYQRLATTARSFGMEMELLSPTEVKALWPLMDTSDLVGASYLPTDGQASPSDITQSLAKGARNHGAVLLEQVRVTGFEMAEGQIVAVHTARGGEPGMVRCEKVVACAGQWTRQLCAKVGVSVPLQPVKHQYIITEPMDGIESTTPTVRDPDRFTYFKEEVGGLVIGGYEGNPVAWQVDAVPDDFQFQLFDDDWEHFEQHMEQAVARVPALERAGVKQMINGPESFTPDGNFILGKGRECANLFVGAGFNAFGIASGGGAGWVLARWVVDGEAPLDLWSVDIRRFSGLHRDADWTRERTLEAYGKHYTIGFPHEEYVSGRPRIVSPLYERLEARRAVFGSKLGWERPNWFAPAGEPAHDVYSMGRQNWFDTVGEEHAAVREAVGLFDQSSFAKFEVTGPDAARSLDRVCANEVARPAGQVTYTQLLNTRGGIECDLTVARLDEERFYLVTGTGFREHDFAWIAEHLPGAADVRLEDVTEHYGTLSLMGPRARDVLASVTPSDVGNAALPFGRCAGLDIAGHRVRALRITYVGELGYELHVPLDATGDVFDALMVAGAPHGLRPAGYRAIESLRLEKGYRAWGSDISPNDSPFEAGLGWAVKLDTATDFIGRPAAEAAAASVPAKRLATFTVDDPGVVLLGRETILRDGELAGYLSSGGYGYTHGGPIGLGYVREAGGVSTDYLRDGRYELVVATRAVPARIHLAPLYDPRGARVRT